MYDFKLCFSSTPRVQELMVWWSLQKFMKFYSKSAQHTVSLFQTGVSEFCLSKNRLVRWSMTSSEILKWGNGWTSHNNDMSVPCRSWKTVPAFKFRESRMSQIKAHGCTGRCSLSFCKKTTIKWGVNENWSPRYRFRSPQIWIYRQN